MLATVSALVAAVSLTVPFTPLAAPAGEESSTSLGNTVLYVKDTTQGSVLMRGVISGSTLSNERPVTVNVSGVPVDVAVNPQGDKAAVVLETSAADILAVLDLATDSVSQVASAVDISGPSFGAAGDRVVFSVSNSAKARPHPRIVSLQGDIIADMPDHKPAYSPSLSPDSRWVAYAKGTPGIDKDFPLVIADSLGIGVTSTVESFTQGGALDVAWAPDGSAIGYTMFTGAHYGVALTDAWGKCAGTVLFEDQTTGRNNALFYHFGGFSSSTQMLAFLEDRTSGKAEVRTFSADPCSREFTGVVKGSTIVPAFQGQVLAASTSWVAAQPRIPSAKWRFSGVRQQNKKLDVSFAPAFDRGYGPLKVTYMGPDGRARLAWEGFQFSGESPEVAPSTMYTIDGFVAPWSSPALNLGASATYRTPDATTLTVEISRKPPSQERYRPGTVTISGRLAVTASDFGLPYQRVGFTLRNKNQTRFLYTASTDAEGFFSFDQVMPSSGTVVATYTGDNDRFADDWSRPVKVTSLVLKANPGVTGVGKAVKWSVTLAPNVPNSTVQLEVLKGGKWSLVRAFPGKGKIRTLSIKAAPGSHRAVLTARGNQLVSVSSPRSLVLR